MPSLSHAIELFGSLSISGSQGSSSIANETESPKVNLYAVGGTLGTRLFGFLLLGVRSSYSQIDQTSEPSTLIGNRRGTRFVPASPMLGWFSSFAKLQADYQMSGDYLLSNSTTSGNQIIYKKPSGFGVELIFDIKSWLGAGIRYEEVSFAREQVGSAAPTDLQNKLTLKSVGAVLDIHF